MHCFAMFIFMSQILFLLYEQGKNALHQFMQEAALRNMNQDCQCVFTIARKPCFAMDCHNALLPNKPINNSKPSFAIIVKERFLFKMITSFQTINKSQMLLLLYEEEKNTLCLQVRVKSVKKKVISVRVHIMNS